MNICMLVFSAQIFFLQVLESKAVFGYATFCFFFFFFFFFLGRFFFFFLGKALIVWIKYVLMKK